MNIDWKLARTPHEVLMRAAETISARADEVRSDMCARPRSWGADREGVTPGSAYRSEIDGGLGGAAGNFAKDWTPDIAAIISVMLEEAAERLKGARPGNGSFWLGDNRQSSWLKRCLDIALAYLEEDPYIVLSGPEPTLASDLDALIGLYESGDLTSASRHLAEQLKTIRKRHP